MKRVLQIVCCGLLILLAGCSSLQSYDSSWINKILYTPTPAPTQTSTPTPPSVRATDSGTEQPQPAIAEPNVLRVWLPPQFNPNANNAAAGQLKQRLAAFEAQHPGLEIEVRIKAEQGEADLLNSLAITSMAAPGALPDLVALPRPALEAAAQKGLVRPLEGYSATLDNSADWYPYARDLAKIDGIVYGLPFAGDALVIMYRSDLVWIKTWDDILLSEQQLIFPGADPQAELGLALYVSAGGSLLDAQGHPTLDQETLTQVLELFAKGRAATLFPDAAANIATDEQAMQEYRARRTEMVIAHFSHYRASQDALLQPLMGLKGGHFTFASGWIWALAGQNSENQPLATELMEFLTADDFYSQWVLGTGYLPTRPSKATTNGEASPISAIIEAAQPIPSADTFVALGPAMQEAIVRVLGGEQPEAVARSVVTKIK